MSLAEVQRMSDIPAIAYFCSLFSRTLGTEDIDIEDLEAALVDGLDTEDMFGGTFLDNLLVGLLRGCLPMYSSKITCSNYNTYLRQLFTSKIEDFEEENITGLVSITNPFDDDREEFALLPLEDRVQVLRQLTEFRLEAEDVPEKIKDIPVESMRLDPLGSDSEGVVYWYFYGTRLYKEVIKRRQTKEKPKPSNDNDNKGKKKKKKQKVEEEEKVEKVNAPSWYLVCRTEEDWSSLAETLRKSKKKTDKELHSVIVENFLPAVTKMFQEKEREEKIKILLMNKRSSSRIDRKKKEQEEREEKDRHRQELRRKEEEMKILKEKENKSRSREDRVRSRVEKIQKVSPQVGRAQRTQEREQKRRHSDSLREERSGLHNKMPEDKRTRLDLERTRREIERDHDYLGARGRQFTEAGEEGGAQVVRGGAVKLRKLASAEWSRLQEDDSQIVRSIRF